MKLASAFSEQGAAEREACRELAPGDVGALGEVAEDGCYVLLQK